MAWIEPGNVYLNQTQMDNNAWEVYNFFTSLNPPWQMISVAALCGNMQLESTINPGKINSGSGAYGLTQWTNNKTKMQTWCTTNGYQYDSGIGQTHYIEWERANPGPNGSDQWYATPSYNLSMSAFAYNSNNNDLNYLTAAFKYNYERNNNEDTATRQHYAQHYYELFGGSPPGPGNLLKKILGALLKPTWYLPYTRFRN